ncbi:hypothetical protein K501DRAFT_335831 [Backusella circina FSU 941]|nr:hypothetical protein K501DRAFT_335831 [Backusella circina FSU 941]
MKSNYYEHLAWYEHSVRPNVVTPGNSSTRCWHATKRKEIGPFNPTSGDSPTSSSIESSIVTTHQRKRPRIDSDEEEEREKEVVVEVVEEEITTFASVAVQTSPLLRGIERADSMETVYFDACDELFLDENLDESKEKQYKKSTLLDGVIYQKLNTLFKSKEFIPNQYEAIHLALNNQHVLVVLPAGPCRELCYLLPSTMTEHHTKRMKNAKTFVLFPFEEQLPNKDQSKDIPKRIIISNNNKESPWISIDQLYQHLCEYNIKVVYMTIKDFAKHKTIMQELYKQNFISRLVIEESHCLSARSPGIFQAKYRYLVSDIRSTYPELPIMALTSIPFNTVHSDIIDALSIRDCKIFKNSLLL